MRGLLLPLVAALALGAAGCSSDDKGDNSNGADSGVPPADAAASADAGSDANPGGAAGPGDFCNTLPDGGPSCEADLECCSDMVCRAPGDCPGAAGFIPCDCTDDCPSNSFICCETAQQTFCTKRSACNSYGGTEDTTCP